MEFFASSVTSVVEVSDSCLGADLKGWGFADFCGVASANGLPTPAGTGAARRGILEESPKMSAISAQAGTRSKSSFFMDMLAKQSLLG
jgi:hypothetical protein